MAKKNSAKTSRKLKEVKTYLPEEIYEKLKKTANKNLSAYLRNLITLHLHKIEALSDAEGTTEVETEKTEGTQPESETCQEKRVVRSVTDYERKVLEHLLRLTGEIAFEMGNISRHISKCPPTAEMLKYYRRLVQLTGVLTAISRSLDHLLSEGVLPYIDPEKITVKELHLVVDDGVDDEKSGQEARQ